MLRSWLSLWPFIRPYKGQVIFALLLGFFYAQLTLLFPILAQMLISALNFMGESIAAGQEASQSGLQTIDLPTLLGFNSDHWLAKWLGHNPDFFLSDIKLSVKDLIRYVAFSFPVYFLIYGIFRFFHFFLVNYIGEKVVSDIRMALMNKFMDLDVMYLGRQKKGSGGLLSRTLNDTIVLQNGLQYYGDLFREPIIGFFLIIWLFVINWKLALGCFLFLPLIAGVIRYVSKSLKKIGHQTQEALEEVTKTLKEGLDGVRVIQSFNLQSKMKQRFSDQVHNYLDRRKNIIIREEMGSPINEWIVSFLVCGICLFQIEQIASGESSLPSFLGFVFTAGLLDKPVKKTQQAIIRIQQNVVATERLNEVLDSATEVREPESPHAFPVNWDEIEFNDVHFSYNESPVLKGINLKIKKGEIVALVGESGSGKSTLAGLLQRFFDPISGKILIGNTDLNQMTTQDLRSRIGYVTQDVFLFDETIENNIRFGDLERDIKDVPAAAKMANASSFIEQLDKGLQSNVGERGGRLSGGEKQRISIARAVFKDPPILILDEATSALDSASELEVQKGIETLLKGRTALIIAHRLSTIKNSDRIIVMKQGEIVEEGTHEQLIAKDGEYSRFYNLQYIQ